MAKKSKPTVSKSKPTEPAVADKGTPWGNTVDLLTKQLKGVGQEKDRQEAALQKLQERLRKDTYNAELRAEVQAAKREIGKVCDAYADMARAVASASGGKNHFPAP